ncbi:hypothetical protein HOY80DRAFT_520932 [Tuber brumale]|nr:hypothetical protein HOY80DRAFT_520932 [Tuber brumale]
MPPRVWARPGRQEYAAYSSDNCDRSFYLFRVCFSTMFISIMMYRMYLLGIWCRWGDGWSWLGHSLAPPPHFSLMFRGFAVSHLELATLLVQNSVFITSGVFCQGYQRLACRAVALRQMAMVRTDFLLK